MRPRRRFTRRVAIFTAFAPAVYYTFALAKHHAVTLERAAVVIGLAAIAIAQPIFEVVANSPEFFAARGTAPATAVTAVLAISFGIPVALLAIERALRSVSPKTAAVFFSAAVAVLSAAATLPWIKQIEGVVFPMDAAIAFVTGVCVAAADARNRVARQFLVALGLAALVVPALFLADPVVRQTLQPFESAASLPAVERKPPIVLVIFDELPLNSLLAADGTIDAGRYPNFATFARDSYWFRNTSTVASNTSHAVPAILSGRYPTTVNDVPTIEYYPVNLFTALAPHYEISASFRFRTLCPRRACLEAGVADTVGSLLADLGVVWLHIVLPDTLASTLPPVTEDWGEFARDDAPQSRDIRNDREGLFAQFVSSIDGRPARVHFIHSMLPHMAFEYVPSGRRYHRPDYESLIFRRSRLFERSSPAYADSLHQRHLAQVGFVDHLVGSLVARLREVGAYDEALVIITADHGASYRGGRSRSATSPTSFACRCSSNCQGSGAAKWSTRLSRRSISSPRSCTSLAPRRHFTSTDVRWPTTGFRSERHGRSSGATAKMSRCGPSTTCQRNSPKASRGRNVDSDAETRPGCTHRPIRSACSAPTGPRFTRHRMCASRFAAARSFRTSTSPPILFPCMSPGFSIRHASNLSPLRFW